MDRSKWRKFIKDVRWSGWMWVGECFFLYRPTRVVPDQRPLNGCVCDPERCIQMCGHQWSCPICWLMIARLTFPLSKTLSVYPNNMGVAARSSPSPADGGWAGEVTTATRRRRCCHPLPRHQSPFIFQSRSVTFTADTYRHRLTAQGRWIGIGWKWRTRSSHLTHHRKCGVRSTALTDRQSPQPNNTYTNTYRAMTNTRQLGTVKNETRRRLLVWSVPLDKATHCETELRRAIYPLNSQIINLALASVHWHLVTT